jgi:hypothetical protein
MLTRILDKIKTLEAEITQIQMENARKNGCVHELTRDALGDLQGLRKLVEELANTCG